MENYLEDDYSELNAIVKNIITNGMKCKDTLHFFDFVNFREKMEVEFAKLGLRDVVPMWGGGIKNILILRSLCMGDLINTSAAIREIRENYPKAHITLITTPHCYEAVRSCPYVNKVLLIDETKLSKMNLMEILAYVTEFAKKYLWNRRFDIGINFSYLPTHQLAYMLLLYVSGAKKRIGYVTRVYRLYTDDILPPEKNPGNILLTHPLINPRKIIYKSERMLYLLKGVGLKVRDNSLEIWYDQTDMNKANKLMNSFAPNRLKIAVGINASVPQRKYPVEKYLPVLKEITNKGAAIVIFGGPKERTDAKFLQENLPKATVLNLTEILPGRGVESAIIANFIDLYLGNFTGTLDVAMATRTPVIGLSPEPKEREKLNWGVTAYSLFYPWQTEAIVLRPKYALDDCKYGGMDFTGCNGKNSHCITQIEPEEIVAAYDEMIHFIKNSPLKRNNSSPTIRGINQAEQLKYLF